MTSIWITILGMLISSLVSVVFSDKIIICIRKIMFRFGILKDVDLSGKWEATFFMNDTETYREIIELKHTVGLVWGRIVPDDQNYSKLKLVMNNKPLRVKGSVNDNRYFTGFWYHPIETYRNHGSYQMLIYSTSLHMEGQWIGFSESSQIINHGKWVWDKIQDTAVVKK